MNGNPDRFATRAWQIGTMLSGFWIWWTAYRVWSTTPTWLSPAWQIGSDVLLAVGLTVLIVGSTGRRSLLRWLLPSALVASLGFYAVFLHATLAVQPGTDELALMRYAGQLLISGRNPYLTSLSAAFRHYFVPATETTPTTAGTLVSNLSYPALGPWLFGICEALGVHDPMWILIGAYLLSMALTYLVTPDPWRPFVLLAFLVDRNLLTLTLNGVTDILYVPFLVGVVALWRKSPIWACALFGLACAIKQTPWIFAPFLVMGLWYDAQAAGSAQQRPWRTVFRGAGAFLAAFLVTNLPFAVLTPRAWLFGTLAPLVSHLVTTGQGVASVAFFGPVAGTPFLFLEAGGVIAAFVGAVWLYPRYPAALWILPLGAYFLAARSLANYWGFAAVPAVLAVTLWEPVPEPAQAAVSARRRRIAPLLAGTGAAAMALLVTGGMALAMTRARVSVVVQSLADPTRTDLFSVARLRVTDKGPVPVSPSFMLTGGAQDETLWTQISGPKLLEPGRPATVVIRAPNLGSAVPDTPDTGVVVSALVPPSRQYPSRPFMVPVTHALANGRFRYWLPNLALRPSRELPVGWTGQTAPTGDEGIIRKPYGVRLVPAVNVGGGWWSTSLVQTVSFKTLMKGVIVARIRAVPEKFSLASSSLAGIEVQGANSVELWVVPAAARVGFAETLGDATVIGEPVAAKHGWWTLTLNLRALERQAHLAPNLQGNLELAVAAAAKRDRGTWLDVQSIEFRPTTR